MISVSPCLFYFYVLNIQNVLAVRIFQNVLPQSLPTKFDEYVPEILSKTCLLKPQEGPCRGNIKMFYYDPAIGNCSTFKWGGCQGNGNRFNTHSECQNACLTRQGGPKRRPKWCALTFDYGFCFGAVKRYYFDNLWKVCKTTIYSGCGGNRNNFYSHEQCEAVCLYGNGPLTLAPEVTAPTKVLIINPNRAKVRTRSQNRNPQDGRDDEKGDENVGANGNKTDIANDVNDNGKNEDTIDNKGNNNNYANPPRNENDKANFIANENAVP